ncbi:hypothetical protein ACRALDRAFT_1061363 [Sodiomyces alcalophilus JCM 7366]|uniref:uncharacterized protein n=1 Tax=Sodiomyces alcalophilus JCM 7366 TaxID=591952 RepID=UPI0039B6C5EB
MPIGPATLGGSYLNPRNPRYFLKRPLPLSTTRDLGALPESFIIRSLSRLAQMRARLAYEHK